MDSYEDRLASVEAEWRAKYNAEELKAMAGKEAMADESYPIADQDDLEKAIKAVGRGNADHDTIRKHIMARAKALKLSSLVPDNWNADGSLSEEKDADADAETRAQCPTCKGSGTIMDGNRECPKCHGSGKAPEQEQKAAEAWDAEHRSGPSHAQLASAISSAIRDLPDAGKLSAYLCDFDDDTAIYESGGRTFQVPYTEKGDGSVKLGDPQEVQLHTEYKPVEAKSADTQAEERAVRRRKERRRAVPLGNEFRFRPLADAGIEVREQKDTNELIVTGKPIKYGVPYVVRDAFGEFEETMHSGCVTPILDRVDCRFLVNHEGIPMARVKSERSARNTMRLWDEPDALNFEARLDARQQIANDFAIALERGDIDEMSVGMRVGRDKWGVAGDMETRDIFGLDDLLDVSGVTYACSPTTSIEVAKRMALEMPVESRARLRRFEVDLRAGRMSAEELADILAILQGHEERAGKVLSKAHQGQLVEAAKSIHGVLEAAGYDPAELIADDGPTEPESEETALAQDGTRSEDGEPIRSQSAATLRLQLEARSKKRNRRKIAA
jgi:phage head maturation protease